MPWRRAQCVWLTPPPWSRNLQALASVLPHLFSNFARLPGALEQMCALFSKLCEDKVRSDTCSSPTSRCAGLCCHLPTLGQLDGTAPAAYLPACRCGACSRRARVLCRTSASSAAGPHAT